MVDYIDRQEAIKEIKEWATVITAPKYLISEDAICVLQNLPAANVKEIKYGEWIGLDDCMAVCSECGRLGCYSNYCPNCGAKMEDNQ